MSTINSLLEQSTSDSQNENDHNGTRTPARNGTSTNRTPLAAIVTPRPANAPAIEPEAAPTPAVVPQPTIEQVERNANNTLEL